MESSERSTETAGVSAWRPYRRRAGPFSESPPSSCAGSNQKTARSTIALTRRNRSRPLSWWHGCSRGINRGSHDGMTLLLRALALRVAGFLKAEVRQCDQQVRRKSKPSAAPSHVWCFAMLNRICVARACVRFPMVAKRTNLSLFVQFNNSIGATAHSKFRGRNLW